MTIAILYRDELREYDFGPGHPFRGDRYEIFSNFLKERVLGNDIILQKIMILGRHAGFLFSPGTKFLCGAGGCIDLLTTS